MNAEYPLSHAYFERAILIGQVLKQPMTALISKWKVSDTDDERSVYTGIQTVSVIWKLWVSSLFLCKFLSYIRPPVGEPKQCLIMLFSRRLTGQNDMKKTLKWNSNVTFEKGKVYLPAYEIFLGQWERMFGHKINVALHWEIKNCETFLKTGRFIIFYVLFIR